MIGSQPNSEESSSGREERAVNGDGARGLKALAALAEGEGFDSRQFESRVWDVLSAAVEYKLRTLVEEAVRVNRRSFKFAPDIVLDARSILTAAKLIRWSPTPSFNYRTNSHDDTPINLQDVMHSHTNLTPPPVPVISLRWTAVEGHAMPEYGSVSSQSQERQFAPSWRFTKTASFKRDFLDVSSEANRKGFFLSVVFDALERGPTNVRDSQKSIAAEMGILALPQSLKNSLSEEQRFYIDRVAAVTLQAIENTRKTNLSKVQKAHDKLALSKLARSLTAGSLPPKIVPFIIALICKEFPNSLLEGPAEALLILLGVLQAFMQNQSINFYAYLHQILYAYLMCLLTPLIGGSSALATQQSIEVRRTAAQGILQLVTSSAASGSTAAYSVVTEILTAVLQRPTLPLPTLIGAVLCAERLGAQAIRKAVVPVLDELVECLRTSLEQASSAADNSEQAAVRESLKKLSSRVAGELQQ